MTVRTGGRGRAVRYPPLAVVILALALAIFALPSALNLPQANPGQTLEYAPVPGDQGKTQPGGNIAGLGLGAGGSAAGNVGGGTGADQPGGLPPPLQNLVGQASNPSQFSCVGNPPRQTPDPLSPPCVAYFKGDNGGSTWVGVTRDQVTVVFRFVELNGNCHSDDTRSNKCGAPSGYYDMDKPSDYNQYYEWTDLHNWETYFNTHYQTYGRHVHFWAANYGDTQDYAQNGYGPAKAGAQAADAFTQLHPFAAWDETNLFSDTYSSYLVQHQALSFGVITQQLATRYPGHYWSYNAPVEYTAREYATFMCTRVIKPAHVTFSGNGDTGAPRRYGLLLTDDPQWTSIRHVQDLAVQYMKEQCGFHADDTAFFHYANAFSSTGPNAGWGTGNMAKFKSEHITTVVWPGGEESEDMTAADRLQYYPEWALLGDQLTSGNLMSAQASREMDHAWVVTSQTLQNANGYAVEPACLDALLEVNPQISRTGADIVHACNNYANLFDDIRQVFTGIQLAGPKLTPQSMDQGFHAIPAKASPGPAQAACYYLPGDYTCVKDATAEWFDTKAPQAASESSGCWRMWRGGVRYLPGQWPDGDINQRNLNTDVCNLFGGGLGTAIRP